jgi:hypothetical protein
MDGREVTGVMRDKRPSFSSGVSQLCFVVETAVPGALGRDAVMARSYKTLNHTRIQGVFVEIERQH